MIYNYETRFGNLSPINSDNIIIKYSWSHSFMAPSIFRINIPFIYQSIYLLIFLHMGRCDDNIGNNTNIGVCCRFKTPYNTIGCHPYQSVKTYCHGNIIYFRTDVRNPILNLKTGFGICGAARSSDQGA